MTRLLQSGLINPEDLARKYADELHANEITLLAYYVAAVNIETTYHALVDHDGGAAYTPFEGIVLADTFQISEDGDSLDADMFPQNNDRIIRQNAKPIDVVIGNPPYSVGQTSANDLNANITYPTSTSASPRHTRSGRPRLASGPCMTPTCARFAGRPTASAIPE